MPHPETVRAYEIDEKRRALVAGGFIGFLTMLTGCRTLGGSTAANTSRTLTKRSGSPNLAPTPLTPDRQAAFAVQAYANSIDKQLRKDKLPSGVRSFASQGGNEIMLINLEQADGSTSSLKIFSALDGGGHYQENAVTKVEYAQLVNGAQQNMTTLTKYPGSRPAWDITIQDGMVPEVNTANVTSQSMQQFQTAYNNAVGNIQENIIVPAASVSARQ